MNIGFSFVSLNSQAVQNSKASSVEAAGSIAMFTPSTSVETVGSVASSSSGSSSSGSSFSCVA